MKTPYGMKLMLSLVCVTIAGTLCAQEFDKNIALARTAYGQGDLEDTRFNLQNALHDIDMTLGREMLKILPTEMDGMNYNPNADNVSGMSSIFAGLFVHRDFGMEGAKVNLEVVSDSPLLASVNAMLAMPMIMNSRDAGQKVVKVHGYKSLLHTNRDENNKVTSYEVQIPFNNSMLTFHYDGDPGETKVMALANSLPIEQIVKLSQ